MVKVGIAGTDLEPDRTLGKRRCQTFGIAPDPGGFRGACGRGIDGDTQHDGPPFPEHLLSRLPALNFPRAASTHRHCFHPLGGETVAKGIALFKNQFTL